MVMSFSDAHRKELGIEPICRELAIAFFPYHEHAPRLADPGRRPARVRRDDELREAIKRVHDASFGLYGMREVWQACGGARRLSGLRQLLYALAMH